MADIERTRLLRKKRGRKKLVWSWLRDRRFTGCKFRRQHPPGTCYLDFFCEGAELSVELDGSQHSFPDHGGMMGSGKSICNRAELKCCDFGIPICGGTHKASATRFSTNYRSARRIHCRNTQGR